MAEQLLDGAEIGAGAEEVRGERVAERVRRGLRGGTAHEHVALEQAADAPGREAAAAVVAEHGAARGVLARRAAGVAIGGQCTQGRAPHRDDALLPALAEHAERRRVEVDVLPVEADQLTDTNAGGVEDLDERAIPETEQLVRYGR